MAHIWQTLSRTHTAPGGAVIVEPWFSPETWEAGRLSADLADQPELKIARMMFSGRAGLVSSLDIHYLAARPGGVEHVFERHELGLFTHEEYLTAFRDAGPEVRREAGEPFGRGLYAGAPS